METFNHDLYTIPSYSSWFSWSSIHEIERISLREFFDGSSITRSPRIYKEYRDFIISKYREDPSRPRLTFTDVRKSLVGDVNSLQKVFTFLEKWGLINFTENASDAAGDAEKKFNWAIRVEEGAPYGVRVAAVPNSLKTITAPPPPPLEITCGAEVAEIGTKFPPLASYSNLFEELMVQKQGKKCGSCKESCDSGYYELIKQNQDEEYTLCKKCFDNSSYGEDKSIDDFKFVDKKNQEVVWTRAETLLLLESVLKHGDDWDLVAENVKTKTKLDCIHKLLLLPFGEILLGSSFMKNRFSDANGDVSGVDVQISLSESQETASSRNDDKKMEIMGTEEKNQDEKMENVDSTDNKNLDEKMENAGGIDDKNRDEKLENASGTDDKNRDEKMENSGGTDDKNRDEKMEISGGTDDKNREEKTENAGGTVDKNPDEKIENAGTDDNNQDVDEMEDASHDDKIPNEKKNADLDEKIANGDQDEKIENAEEQGPPRKRRRREPIYDASSSLMKQVARLSSVVGPLVTASAAEAAIAELCYENGCTKEIFDDDNFAADAETKTSSPSTNKQKIITEGENADGLQSSMVPEHEDKKVQRNVVSLTLRTRAATATALGAVAAHAKLLANQEEREIEHLFATVLEIQLKKLNSKAKHLESMEVILEKQLNQIEDLKDFMISERINVLQEIFSRGLSRSNDHPSLQHQSSTSV